MNERHLIGFSLSFCVKDICEGLVDIKDVLFIQTACAPNISENVDDIIAQYCRTYWHNYPEQAKKVFDELMNDPDGPRIGWASTYQKNVIPIYWGNWLSTHNAIRPANK